MIDRQMRDYAYLVSLVFSVIGTGLVVVNRFESGLLCYIISGIYTICGKLDDLKRAGVKV